MKTKTLIFIASLALSSCNLPIGIESTPPSPAPTLSVTDASAMATTTLPDGLTLAPSSDTPLSANTSIPFPTTGIITPSSTPVIGSLKAQVTADLLSCRYGPGPEYLFLYGLRKGANIKLIGRTDGNNWVYVDGKNKCWVNKKFIEIEGDALSLPIAYPGIAKLPVSPYYPPTAVLSATRDGNTVEISWLDIPLRAGDEEDETMQHYIIEVWRCKGGNIIFDPLGTNELSISFVDEPGCTQPSHGRVFVQEKHGFAGPAEISWPKHIP